MRKRASITDEEMLMYDFFSEDKDDNGDHLRRSRIVQRTRVEHECLFAPEWRHPMPAGTRARVDEAVDDVGWARFYTCADCHERARREQEEYR